MSDETVTDFAKAPAASQGLLIIRHSASEAKLITLTPSPLPEGEGEIDLLTGVLKKMRNPGLPTIRLDHPKPCVIKIASIS